VPEDDNDLDSIINLLEIAFGSDPEVADSPEDVLPQVTIVDDFGSLHAAIVYRRPVGGTFDFGTQTYTYTDLNGDVYVYEVQCSTDLKTWTAAGDLAAVLFQDTVDPHPTAPGVEVATFRLFDTLPGADPTKYLRTRVTRTPAP
jgi:hypothetical protein